MIKKTLYYLHKDMYLELFAALLLILSFCFEPASSVFAGYVKIITSPSILLTDYVYIAGTGATLLNVASVLIFNIILVKLLDLRITGPIYAGMFMVVGFSFFGKNLINTLPILFGIWLYTRHKKISCRSVILAIFFSTGISPIVSYCFFGFGLRLYLSIPLGIICGVIVGFIVPAYSAHTNIFHSGYNIYNTGFALGIISALFYSLFSACGLSTQTVRLYDSSHAVLFEVLLGSVCIIFILIAVLTDKTVFPKYRKLLKTSGKLISDYIGDFSIETVMLNFGITGLFLLVLVFIFGIPLNGIIFGSIISVLGCCAFGLHIRNILPVWVGCALAILLKLAVREGFYLDAEKDLSMIVAFIFATGLAPFSRKYGTVYGIAGGFMHIILTPLMIALQGGFDLYNNGFSAGFEASILFVCAEKIFNKEK
ncbi:MAG: DUF1576 domain-containing protein [Oscillospiraceae bacterium]|nr:DUF1576 domain-containing protein [Oscillospiraceae bacterium]